MIKRASGLRHSPPEEESSLKTKEFCRGQPQKNIPKTQHSPTSTSKSDCGNIALLENFPRQGLDPVSTNRRLTYHDGFRTGFEAAHHGLYLKEKNYSSPAVTSEGSGFQQLPSFRSFSGRHSTSPQAMISENSTAQMNTPRMVYDNMVIGHFMPHCFLRPNQEKTCFSDRTLYTKFDKVDNATDITNNRRRSTHSIPTMHLDLLPSPPNSTNSPSEPSFQALDPEPPDISTHPFSFQNSSFCPNENTQNCAYLEKNVDSTSLVQRSSQISLDITPSGCTLLNSSTINKEENDVLDTFLDSMETNKGIFAAKPQYCDVDSLRNPGNTVGANSSNAAMEADRDFHSHTLSNLSSVYMSPQEPSFSNEAIEQTLLDISQSIIPDPVTCGLSTQIPKANAQDVKQMSSLGRYSVLPHISNQTVSATEVDNISLMSYTSSNNGAQIGSGWYPSYSPFTSDTQSIFTNSPRQSGGSSFSGRGSRNKRALSNSPLSAEGIDLNSIIRMSPTSLYTYLAGSRSSSSCVSPGSTGEKAGCYGHLSAHNSSSSPHSGSVSSATRPSISQTPRNFLSDETLTSTIDSYGIKDNFLDMDSSNLVLQAMQELEAGCGSNIQDSLLSNLSDNPNSLIIPQCDNLRILPQDMAAYKTNEYLPYLPVNSLTPSVYYQTSQLNLPSELSKDGVKTLPPLPKKPPPTYDQHMARKATLQKKSSSDSSQPSNSNSSSFESSESDKTGVGGSSSTDTEQNRMYECQWLECSAVFQDQEEFVTHIEKMHIDQRKGEEFSCLWRTCVRKTPFNARYKLLMHMRVHSGEKPNRCTYTGCKKAFSRLENLKIHIRSHTGERPYSCLYQGCVKTFSNSSDRAKHQKTHQDMRPYVCQVPGCGKRYTDPSSLRKHAKGSHIEKKEHGRKKIRNGIEELDPKDLSECLVIQAINVSPPEPTDSGLGRSPRASQLGSSTDYYTGFSTSGETNSRSGSAAQGSSSTHTSPSSQHSSPRTLNDISETTERGNSSTLRVPKLPAIGNMSQQKNPSLGKQQATNYRSRPPSSRLAVSGSSTGLTSPRKSDSRISLSSMTRDLLSDQNLPFTGYYNLNQGIIGKSTTLSSEAILLDTIARFENIS